MEDIHRRNEIAELNAYNLTSYVMCMCCADWHEYQSHFESLRRERARPLKKWHNRISASRMSRCQCVLCMCLALLYFDWLHIRDDWLPNKRTTLTLTLMLLCAVIVWLRPIYYTGANDGIRTSCICDLVASNCFLAARFYVFRYICIVVADSNRSVVHCYVRTHVAIVWLDRYVFKTLLRVSSERMKNCFTCTIVHICRYSLVAGKNQLNDIFLLCFCCWFFVFIRFVCIDLPISPFVIDNAPYSHFWISLFASSPKAVWVSVWGSRKRSCCPS